MAAKMTAGHLRDRVTWYPPVRTKNAAGQMVPTYPTASATTYAKVEPTTGNEADQHTQLTPSVTYRITLRSRTVAGLAHDWRCVWANRSLTLDVSAVLPHPNGDEFVLVLAKERPATTA